jgi:PAS domain S-box-containing protein
MSVKTKALLTTSLILLVMVGTIYVISRILLQMNFARLEVDTQRSSMEHISSAVQRIYTELGKTALDWAIWDDAYHFASKENPSFPEENFNATFYENLNVSLVAIADLDGQILFAQTYDQEKKITGVGPAELKPLMARGGLFWGLDQKNNMPNRLLVTNGSAYFVTARAIFPSSGIPPSGGTLLFGREVTPDLLADLSSETGMQISFFNANDPPPDFEAVRPWIEQGEDVYLHTPNADTLDGYIILEGVDAPVSGVLEATMPRTIYSQGRIVLNYLLVGMLVVVLFALGVNWWVTTTFLIRPMEKLAQRVKGAGNLQEQIRSLDESGTVELDLISAPLQNALLRAQEAQKESHDRQMMVMRLFEQAREGFAILEPESLKILEANQEFVALAEIRADQVGQISLIDIIHGLLDSTLQETLISRLMLDLEAGGGMREFELLRGEKSCTIEISLYPIESGDKLYLYALLRDVTERKELARSLQERLNETILLNRVITAATSNLEPSALFQIVCTELAQALNVPQAVAAVLDEDGGSVHFVAEYIEQGRPSVMGKKVDVSGTGLGEAIRKLSNPVAFYSTRDKNELNPFLPLLEFRGVESLLIVPLRVREQVIGLLSLETQEPREFRSAAIQLARNASLAAAQAFGMGQLYRSLQEELQQRQRAEHDLAQREQFLEALVKVQTRMLGGSSGTEIYPTVLKILGEVAQTDRVYIFFNTTGADGGFYTSLIAEWAAPGIRREIENPALQNMTFNGSLQRIYELLSTGQSYTTLVRDLPEEERKAYSNQGIHSFLVLPLNSGGVFRGLIGFDDITRERVWSPGEVALLQVAAAAISMAQERFDAIDALRQSEERYRAVVETANDVIFQIDLSGRFMFLNPSWERVTGIPVSEAIGVPFWKIVPAGMLQQLQTAYRLLRERVTEHYHQLIVLTDENHESTWLDTFARLITDSQGKGHLIAGTMIDITSFKRIEYQLRRNEESLRGLYDITSSQQLSFEQKISNLLMMGSRTFDMESASLNRIEDEYLIVEHVFPDTGLSMGLPGSVMRLGDTFTREILRAHEPIGVEHVGETDLAGLPAYLNDHIEAILGTPVTADNEDYGVLYFTSLKQRLHGFSVAEKEFVRLMAQWIGAEIERDRHTRRLQQYNEEIAQKSRELAEARDQALEASRLKSEFLATMSHEIRTPLNAVIGMTELLLETPLNGQQDEFSRIIQESGKSLLGIINDILDFSKIEAGRMTLEEVEFELLPVIEGVVDMFLQAAHAKGISIMSYVSPQIPRLIVGDPARIRQVLVNLVGNAVKFTNYGEVIVRVGLGSQDEHAIRLLIKVNDSGIGLSEVARHRLFQPFTQADGSTTRKYGGTGLGLAISKRLVELMGGDVGVVSEEGVGSTFWFTLQLKSSSAANTLPPDPGALFASLRVLVADPDPAHRRILCAYLHAWKATAEPARAAIEAIEMLEAGLGEEKNYNVLIWGFDQAGQTWTDLRRYLDDTPRLAGVRTIFLAQLEQRGSTDAHIEPGRSSALFRPVKQSSLFDEIAMLFASPDDLAKQVRRTLVDRPVGGRALAHGRIILLAEDNPANQRLAIAQLERLGFNVELAVNGQRALDTYTAHPDRFDLILMDCQMPEMDGFEASQKIRELESRLGGHVTIVAMTANAMQGDREACLAAGMDDYISKPVTIDNLRRVLTHLDAADAKPDEGAAKVEESRDPLDRNVLSSLRELQSENEADFLTELIDLFLEDSTVLMDEMRAAVVGGDAEGLRQAMHTLKGSSGSLGAMKLSKMCVEAELMGRSGRLEGMRELLPQLELEYTLAREFLLRERVSEA